MKQREEEKLIIPRFYRYLGNRIAQGLAKTKTSPNQVTFIGLFIGIISGLLIFGNNHYLLILAGILLQLNVILDYVDGSLAHLLSQKSVLGRWLDHNAGIPVDTLLFFAIAFNLYWQRGETSIWILSFLCLTWRYLIRNIYFTFQETGFFQYAIKETRHSFILRVLREFIPSRYLILLFISLALVFNQLYTLLVVFSIYGGLACVGLWIGVYKRIAKIESMNLTQK